MKMKSSFSSKTHTFGCISLILQRFLCSGTSTTHPSDQITDQSFNSPDFSSEPPRARGDEPGALARLMGLDSFPKTRVLTRSRSVNSVDYLKKDKDEIQAKHRRVKSTLEYVELEDDHFFILSFDKDKNEKGHGTRKCKKRREIRENHTRIEGKENNINATNVSPERLEIGELKQRRKERRKRREIKLRQNIIAENNDKENWIMSYVQSQDGDMVKCEVRSMNEEEEEECRSCEESSPVSVLDYDGFAENTSRRRLSSELESRERKETTREDNITLRSRENVQHHDHQEMWLTICRLTVSEIEGSNWVNEKASKLVDFDGIIGEELVSNILDQLLEETITTLSLTSKV